MKHLAFILSVTLLLWNCGGSPKTAESADHTKTIKTQAEAMGKALIDKDYATFAKYISPIAKEKMGGEQTLIAETEKAMGDLALQGVAFVKLEFGEASPAILQGSELQSVIPQTVEMSSPQGIMTGTTALIAISSDEGKNWSFFDSAGQDMQALKAELPNLSDKLVLPAGEEMHLKPE